MSTTIIKVENIGKQYRLGNVGTGSLMSDLNRWWHVARGKEDPYLTVGDENDRTAKSGSDLVWALKDINFEIKQGEVVGIIGKNGAGKSTILKILSRVVGPTVGTIKVKGRIASLLEVGTGFHPDLTGRENIYLNGSILGMSKTDIRNNFDAIIDFSGIERYIDTPVKRYSSGMYVRLAFAVAAHLDPEILIVDEVLSVGDADFQAKCLGKMKDATTEGRTVIFVSHSMGAVKQLCNRAILLKNGTIEIDGPVMEGIGAYMNVAKPIPNTGLIPENASTYTSGEAKFKYIDVKNLKGDSISVLHYNQPFVLDLELEVKRDIDHAIVDVSLGSYEGRYSYTSTYDLDKKHIALKKGIYKISVNMNPNLLPGEYGFYLAVHDMEGSGHSLDLVERIKFIKVLPTTEDNSPTYPLGISLGTLRVDCNWKINKTL